MLRELQLDRTVYDKTAVAIQRIQTMAPVAERLYGGFTVLVSGGKDSSCITDLAIRSGVKCAFEVSWTGLEYPETVRFLRREKKRLEEMGYSFRFIIPRDKEGKQITMWRLIEKKGLPIRQMRFCCAQLKEFAGQAAYCILGIRWAESARRKASRRLHEIGGKQFMTNSDNEMSRRLTEVCLKKRKYMLNPIIDWEDTDVWDYIHERGLPYNPLYDKGFRRVGCIGCPMRANRKELEENPKYAALYKRSAERFLVNVARKRTGYKKDIAAYFAWWLDFCAGGGIRESPGDSLL